ncbi:CheR family methyltransferase [Limibacter armeniacum]|uniref:CheR family methyltransferase n=1 Tax=Limibacter armeniacum TaxID=466084 RepID=UPI002FE53C82
MDKENVESVNAEITPKYVVGIGASAGGLEVLREFFDELPEQSDLSYIVLQHLSPDFKSMMDELLGRYSTMPVRVVQKDTKLEANNVYLIPSDKNLIIEGETLKPVKRDSGVKLNLPIDIFFHSLGKEFKSKAIGIILSGTGTDGSRGARTIKENGGIVLVQSPELAKFDGMPKAAISLGVADFVLPTRQLTEKLMKLSKEDPNNALLHLEDEEVEGSITTDVEIFQEILQMVEKASNIDFRTYRKKTLLRRLEKRMQLNHFHALKEYRDFLNNNQEEVLILQQDFLIGVTQFFRDDEAWKSMQEIVVKKLVENGEENTPLRIWVAGCSTGEEAFTLSILIQEELREQKKSLDYKIFATDIDKRAISIAGQGFYNANLVADLPNEYLYRYFTKDNDGFQVKPTIRDHIVFAQQDLMKDPPFIKMDLVICRNLLIYLENKAQQRVLTNFQFALNHKGYMFLGTSESVGGLSMAFKPLHQKWNIFQSVLTYKLQPAPPSHSMYEKQYDRVYNRPSAPITDRKVRMDKDLSERIFHEILANEYAPALFVNKEYELLFATGDIEKYLTISKGWRSRMVLDMVNRNESMILRNGIRKSITGKALTIFKGVQYTHNNENQVLNIKFKYINPVGVKSADLVLIEFESAKEGDLSLVEPSNIVTQDKLTQERVFTLESELNETKMELQNTVEELETTNEEMQASNEELLASNEELQSSNEELQSVNEELYTVNNELQVKISELKELNNDMSNLLTSTHIGTIFLDRELRIRKITPVVQGLFNISDEDTGRPIVHFTNSLNYDTLEQDARKVLEYLQVVSHEVTNTNGEVFMLRILPYRTSEDRIDGVVITLVNITEIKQLNDKLEESEERFRTAIEALNTGIWEWNILDSSKDWWAPYLYELLMLDENEVKPNQQYLWGNLVHEDDRAKNQEAIEKLLSEKEPYKQRLRIKCGDGEYKEFEVAGKAITDSKGELLKVVGSLSNI